MTNYLGLFLRGLAMGAANVIPGVSGGTIAFITGIFERLINSLKSFDLIAVKLFFTGKFKEFSEKTDLKFLASVLLGVGVSILSLAKLMELAFQYYEVFTLSFFVGLIIASILGVGKQIEKWNFTSILSLLIGTAIAAGIAFLPPAEPNPSFIYVFVCGVVAISSMILPGLSGSYVLLLMGNYLLVLRAVSSFDFSIIIPMGLGCIIGMVAFSHFLSWLFAKFRDATISVLTGFVAGSLAIIWPWKETLYMTLSDGKEKAIGYNWLFPLLDLHFVFATLFAVVGFVLVYWMDKQASQKGKSGH